MPSRPAPTAKSSSKSSKSADARFVVGLTRIGIIETRTLRRSRRVGYFVVCCVGVLLPGVDPVTTTIETIPLLVLYEASIWASVLLERRAERSATYPVGT